LEKGFANDAEFQVGVVLSRSWGTLWKKPVAFLGMTLMSFVIPAIITIIIVRSIASPEMMTPSGEWNIEAIVAILIGAISSYGICMVLFQGAITYAVFQLFMEGRASIRESLGRSFSRLVALFSLGSVSVLGFILLTLVTAIMAGFLSPSLAFIVFIVLLLTLLSSWYVAAPVCVVERAGALASVGRSFELTKGYRLRIIGMLLLVFVLVVIFAAIALFIANVVLRGGFLGLLIKIFANIIPMAFGNVMATVTYYSLRVTKEGLFATSLADIFD
jgi:hypothetical protein